MNSKGETVKVEQCRGTVMVKKSKWNNKVRVEQCSGTVMVAESKWNSEIE